MENKIISTCYAALQPPYQIIKYANDIAMQIGTFIVTMQKEGDMNGMGYHLETHSHPVVVYENKDALDPTRQLCTRRFLEGVVWNYVQVKDVMTICLSNSHLSWDEFTDYLLGDMSRQPGQPRPAINSWHTLVSLGVNVGLPEGGEHEVELMLGRGQTHKRCSWVRSSPGSVLVLCGNGSSEEAMWNDIWGQIQDYTLLFYARKHRSGLRFRYTTKDEACRALVERLNADKRCTGEACAYT